MSKLSKYFKVSDFIVLDYESDLYKITSGNLDGVEEKSYFMYYGNDGEQYLMMDDFSDLYSTYRYSKFPDSNGSTFYFMGTSNDNSFEGVSSLMIDGASKYTINDLEDSLVMLAGQKIRQRKNNTIDTNLLLIGSQRSELGKSKIISDTIKLYLVTGYNFASLSGIVVKVKAKVSTISNDQGQSKTISKYITLLDWFMPKELVKDNVHWLPNNREQVLYLNSRYYDRYIEIKVPSYQHLSLSKGKLVGDNPIDVDFVFTDKDGTEWRGYIDSSMPVLVQFGLVEDTGLTLISDALKNVSTDYKSIFTMGSNLTLGLLPNSVSDYFNVRIYEDPDNHCIVYYPVYGDSNTSYSNNKRFDDVNDLNLDVMIMIENGEIPIVDQASYDSTTIGENDDMANYLEMYGDDAADILNFFKWFIINDLNVQYDYYDLIYTDDNTITSDPDLILRELLSNIVDYAGKTREHGEFWRSRWIPFIKPVAGKSCRRIIVEYTCRLINRYTNRELAKSATLVISDPYKYTLPTVNISNLTTYKIVNKIAKGPLISLSQAQAPMTEKIIRTYYDATDIVMRDPESGSMYSQGKMTLYLKHTSSNYLLRLYKTNNDNVRIPYDLTGVYLYKLVFPSVDGSRVEIFPNRDSENYNLGIGSLMFYISQDNVSKIMNVPSSERYFALTTHTQKSSDETTLYEGHVEYYD